MVDDYGNYFCSRLWTDCSSQQRMKILEMIAHDFLLISCDKKGTHTV